MNGFSVIPIKIVSENEYAIAELTRVTAPRTVGTIVRHLPLEGPSMFKGDQVYFKVHLKLGVEKPRRNVDAKTIGYWPLGDAICIFLRDSKPYSPVNIIGRIISDPICLADRKAGSIMRIEKA
jgi:hypothetical protein